MRNPTFLRGPSRYGAVIRCFNFTAILALTVLYATYAFADPLRIVVLGDSLTAGYGLSEGEAFPAQLEAALRDKGHSVRIVNAGVSGDTTAGGLARLDWALADGPDGPPDAVIVELGGNDGLRGFEPAVTKANLDTILTRVRERGLPVLLTGMLAPPNLGAEYGEEFAAVFPYLSEKHNVPLYPFFLDGVAGDPKLNQYDGIHPNAEGVREIVRRILPAVEGLLNAVESS